MLNKNRTIKTLDLSYNLLEDDFAKYAITTLKVNRRLSVMKLEGNVIKNNWIIIINTELGRNARLQERLNVPRYASEIFKWTLRNKNLSNEVDKLISKDNDDYDNIRNNVKLMEEEFKTLNDKDKEYVDNINFGKRDGEKYLLKLNKEMEELESQEYEIQQENDEKINGVLKLIQDAKKENDDLLVECKVSVI